MTERLRASLRALTPGVVLLLAILVSGLGAAAASAAPSEPTLTVAQLEALLATSPSGTAGGYFKTVLKGSDIVRIPVTVKAVVPQYINGMSMIFFQAQGAAVEDIGGIAAGMSGSPLFVEDHGIEKLAGAVSYGDVFTKGNLGLATPAEYMAHMEDTFLPAGAVTATLPRAVQAGGRTVTRVTVASSARAADALRPSAGTAVMAPLAAVSITGLPQGSAAYKDVAARLAKHGIEVSPFAGQIAGKGAAAAAPFAGGSALAALLARGDVLYGALGTVTWVDGDRLVVFGHPFLGMGSIDAYLTTAVVNGVWASNISPYKMGSVGDLAGSLLQDRGAGVAGRMGQFPDELPVTSTVTLQPQGTEGHSEAYLTDWVVNDFPGGDGVYLAADAVSAAGYQAAGMATASGSATTTTTVVVTDSSGTRYTMVRSNTWDDVYDVLGYLSSDAATMLSMVTADPDGVAPAHVVSVDMTGAVSPSRSSARIVDVRFPRGLRAGQSNPVEVELNQYGKVKPLVVSGTLDVPAGASTTGMVNVFPAATGPSGGEGDVVAPVTGGNDSESVAERVKDVDELPTNDQLVVQFIPDGAVTPAEGLPALRASTDGTSADLPQVTLTAAGSYVSGSLQLRTGQITLDVTPATVRYRGAFTVSGHILETEGATEVDLYAQPYGATGRTKLATVPAESDGLGGATFTYSGGGLTSTTKITADWAGDARALGTTASVRVPVAQSASLTADRLTVAPGGTVRLTARVLPGRPGQPVRFERRSGGSWVLIRTVKASQAGQGVTAAISWTPPTGATRVRVRVPATPANAASSSAALTVRTTVR